jgi:hypothetical protein
MQSTSAQAAANGWKAEKLQRLEHVSGSIYSCEGLELTTYKL